LELTVKIKIVQIEEQLIMDEQQGSF